MTAGLAAILVIAGVLLLGGLGLFWWINRPIDTAPQRATTLPLFASDRWIAPVPIEDVEIPIDVVDEAPAARSITPKDVASLVHGSDAQARAMRFAPPPGTPGATPAAHQRNGAEPATPRATPSRPHTPPASRPVPSPQITGASSARLQLETTAHASQPAAHSIPTPPRAAASPVSDVSGKSVRFAIPTDGTLQFLPGRLEITAGEDQGREIRFVRLPDLPQVRVTFGRVDGPLYRHVQLNMATVSRKHAIMEYEQGAWNLTNLSTTNPVVLNGRQLAEREKHVLEDNDRVEMGEVVFRYRAR